MDNAYVSATLPHSEATLQSPTASGELDPYNEIPWWAHWTSTVILSLTFIIGLPLNGATVLIFCRRKKLRHLVNFVLLLDCLSHILLCLLCIPLHLLTEWSGSSPSFSGLPSSGNLSAIANLQHVIGNFVNLYSTFLTVSIAILRYRRLCWKKKDKFSTINALKWSVCSGILAVGMTFVQFYVVMIPESRSTIEAVYWGKIALIVLAVATVFFCYVRVSQRVWANTANQEKTMDPAKLKKSRSVHMKATIHSCVQIVLVITTVAPHLYLQALEMLAASSTDSHHQHWSGNSNNVVTGSSSDNFEHVAEPFSSAQKQLFSIHHLHQQQHEDQLGGESGGAAAAIGDWIDSTLSYVGGRNSHHESFSSRNNEDIANANIAAENVLPVYEFINNTSGGGGGGDDTNMHKSLPLGITETIAATARLSTFGSSQLARLIAITINYALLALGTPCAYIASCHRFREQFASILFSQAANSPQNSTCHQNQHGHHHSSPGHKAHRYHYYHRSTTGGTQDACFSSPLTRTDRTSTTAIHNHSSIMSRNSGSRHANGAIVGTNGITRDSVSISISANTRSSFSHSFKSRSSLRKNSGCGSSMKRRSSSAGHGGSVCGSNAKGLLGVSIAADSVFIESDSPLILEQNLSNGSSSTGNLKPTPSTNRVDEVSAREASRELERKQSSNHLPLTAVTTISNNSSHLHTYLQNCSDYDSGNDLGQLV